MDYYTNFHEKVMLMDWSCRGYSPKIQLQRMSRQAAWFRFRPLELPPKAGEPDQLRWPPVAQSSSVPRLALEPDPPGSPFFGINLMPRTTLEFLKEQIELNDQLLAGREHMFNPQDLPGRYGRVVKAVDHLLRVINCEAVLGGGWAVWHHGFTERLTLDVDIALPQTRIDEFLQVASVSGFTIVPRRQGRWPKLLHKETGVKVDILPEGARPGTASKPAPTTIPSPAAMGAEGSTLRYMNLSSLVELKIAAGRDKDRADVVVLLRANEEGIDAIRQHLASVHPKYVIIFDELVQSAREQQDE
jgi:hypothetical protein